MGEAGRKGGPKMTPRITRISQILYFSEIRVIRGLLFVLGARE